LLEEKDYWSKQREEADSKLGELAEEVLSLKIEISKIKAKEEELAEEKLFTESTLQSMRSKLKETEMLNDHLEEQKAKIKQENDVIN
jgi:chromosome segregation ATPase